MGGDVPSQSVSDPILRQHAENGVDDPLVFNRLAQRPRIQLVHLLVPNLRGHLRQNHQIRDNHSQ